MFAGLIDVQDRTVFRPLVHDRPPVVSRPCHHRAAETVGWENAHDVLYAGVLDLGVGPHWYSMYEMACTYVRVVLAGPGRRDAAQEHEAALAREVRRRSST